MGKGGAPPTGVSMVPGMPCLISALGHLGRLDAAREALDELCRSRPDFSGSFVRETHLISDRGDLSLYLEGLRKAGAAD